MKLNPEKDIDIDVNNLSKEFRTIGPKIYRYTKEKASLQEEMDMLEIDLKVAKSKAYGKLGSDYKETEKKHEIELDKDVISIQKSIAEVRRDIETVRGYIDGLKANKDMLVQLGADQRKEY